MNVTVAISMGDFNGVGPEIILKSLETYSPPDVTPLILGQPGVFDYYADKCSIRFTPEVLEDVSGLVPGKVNLLICPSAGGNSYTPEPGKISESAGRAAMECVDLGIRLCMEEKSDALVTAPISKEAISMAGYHFPGHTEFLAEKTGVSDFMMVLVSGSLRVGLVTGHIPVSEVSRSLSEEIILEKISRMDHSLKHDFGIGDPNIAVFGLNPHAGDGGVIGDEENEFIVPAIGQARKSGIRADGPFPADGFFGSSMHKNYDGIVAMYHDQGLVPFKALSFGSGVNVTAGLPIVRTSPDHGTAFSIAGKNRADARSFTEAFKLAVQMAGKKISTDG
jgi:4-hydroxythreonine-4-phosphate dehydrogenase